MIIRTSGAKYPNSPVRSIKGHITRVSSNQANRLQTVRISSKKEELYNNNIVPISSITLTRNQALLANSLDTYVRTSSSGEFQRIEDLDYNSSTRVLNFDISTSLQIKYISTFINPPDIEIEGLFIISVSMSANMEDFRSLSIKAYGKLDNIDQIQNNLRSGTEILLADEKWVVSSLNYTAMKRTENRSFDVEIDLSLRSLVSAYLQKISWTRSNTPERVIDFNTLANRAGVKSELPSYSIVIPETGVYGEAIDWFNYAKDIAKINGGIVFHRDSIKFVQILGITKPVLRIKGSKVRSAISIDVGETNDDVNEFHQPLSYSGKNFKPKKFDDSNPIRSGEFIGYLPILNKPFGYYRAEITGDIYLSDRSAISYEVYQSRLTVRSFLRRTRNYSRIESGSRLSPSWMDLSKLSDSVSLSFDQSGYVQNYSVRETLDGKPIRDKQYEYGFKVTGQDIKNERDLGYSWGVYEERCTTYEYEPSYGYYVGEVTTGFTTTREQSEDIRKPEGFDLEIGDAGLEKYEYIEIPIKSGKYIELQKSDDFYPTTDNLSQGYFINELGQLVEDPTYIPDWIVMLEEEFNISYKTYQSETDGLTRYSGKEYVKSVENKIYNTLGTTAPWLLNSSHFSQSEKDKIEAQEQYAQTTTEHGAQDEQFRSNLGIGQSVLVQGRPSTGDRLPSLYDEYQEDSEENKPTLLKNIYPKVYVSSNNYDGVSRHTVSIPSGRTLDDVENALKVDWILNNVKANTAKFTIEYNVKIYEGMLIEVEFDGILLSGFVLSYSHNKSKITTNKVTGKITNSRTSETELTLGLVNLSDLENIDTIVRIEKLQRTLRLTRPYYVGTRLRGSERLTASTQTRFN